jgi:hypothetical protein
MALGHGRLISANTIAPAVETACLRVARQLVLFYSSQSVEEGVAAYEKLLLKLADVPTPAGPTQRQISTGLIQITIVRPHLMSRYYKSKDGTIAASEVV